MGKTLRSEIINKLQLSVMIRKRKVDYIYVKPVVYLVGILPAEVEWSDGKKEKIELMEKVEIFYNSKLKLLAQKPYSIKGAENNKILNAMLIKEVVDKMEAGIKNLWLLKKLGVKDFKFLKI